MYNFFLKYYIIGKELLSVITHVIQSSVVYSSFLWGGGHGTITKNFPNVI